MPINVNVADNIAELVLDHTTPSMRLTARHGTNYPPSSQILGKRQDVRVLLLIRAEGKGFCAGVGY